MSQAGLLPTADVRLLDVTRATVRELLRAPDAQSLFDTACRLAVEVGGFRLAWVGLLDEDGRVEPVARAGHDDGYVDAILAAAGDGPRGQGPTGQALQRGEASYVDDIGAEPRMAPWREAALSRGFVSSAALPLHRDGRPIGSLNIYSGQPAFFRGGERALLEALAEDICFTLDRLDAQARLSRAEQAYRTLFEQAADGIFIADEAGRYVDVNAAGLALLGYSREELLALTMKELIAEQDLVAKPLRLETLVRDRPTRTERVLKRKDGSLVQVEISGTRLSNGTFLGLVRDVTERNELQSRLVVTDRLSALGTLAAGVAHEINNPLAYVMLNLSLLAQHLRGHAKAEPDELSRLVDETLDGAERVARIVRDLRAVTRASEGPPAPVSLRAVAEAALRIASGHVRAKARLTTSFEGDVWVLGDAPRLEQVVMNLLVNAAQAITSGRHQDHEVHVRVRAEGELGVLSVRDTGAGIPPEVQPRIFDPFFTTKPQGEGTGLGLAICHGLVSSLGGRIDFESTVGAGTTFHVRLPLSGAPRVESGTASDEPLAGLRVLVVEDEPAIGDSIRRVLPRCDVVTFTDGRDALPALERGHFDVLLCDVRMPGLSGSDFFAHLRERFPQLERRVVFMTGAIADADVRRFLEGVSNPVLEKPFTPEALALAVRRALAAG